MVRNFRSTLWLVLLPVAVLLINLLLSRSATVDLRVGVVDGTGVLDGFLADAAVNPTVETVRTQYVAYPSEAAARQAFSAREISAFVVAQGRRVILYSDAGLPEGQIAAQTVGAQVQNYTLNHLRQTAPELLQAVAEAQPFELQVLPAAQGRSDPTTRGILAVGLVWIAIYMPLAFASGQIFEERINRTVYLLLKAPVHPALILGAKLIGALVPIAAAYSIFLLLSHLLFRGANPLGAAMLTAVAVVVWNSLCLGYLVALLARTGRESSFLTMILVMPAMMLAGLPYHVPAPWGGLLRLIPTFHAARTVHGLLAGAGASGGALLYLAATGGIALAVAAWRFDHVRSTLR